jgi:hypothetical protein
MPRQRNRRLVANLHSITAEVSTVRKQLRTKSAIVPADFLVQLTVIDATPLLLTAHATTEEQTLLAKVRYNRLIDEFLGLTAYSLQSHLCCTIPNVGSVDVNELYLGINRGWRQFVIPVTAKTGNDQIGIVQIEQDMAFCQHAFPGLTARPVAVQFKKDEDGEVIVMFELVLRDDEVRVVDEKQYRLVPASSISAEDLRHMASAK